MNVLVMCNGTDMYFFVSFFIIWFFFDPIATDSL